jgi:uncharacterized membrane protein YfcA
MVPAPDRPVTSMPVPLTDLLLAMSVISIAAMFQGVVGVGFNVVAVPILLLIDPILAPVPNLMLAAPLTVLQLLRERGDIDTAGVKWILLGRIPGGVIGLGLLVVLSATALNITIALLILSIVVLLATGVKVSRTRATGFLAGLFSGVAGIVGAVGGPPVGLLYKDDPPAVVRSTLGVIFSIGLVMSIGLRALGGRVAATDLQVTLWLLPAMALGFMASNRLRSRISTVGVRRSILLVSTAASLTLLIRTLVG